jgi:HEPN domain-containing protein
VYGPDSGFTLSVFSAASVVSSISVLGRTALLDSRSGLSYPPRVDASEKLPKEWFLQADYDMDTAQYMFDGGRYFYCIFMCHLSIEKALKGLYRARLKSDPPKIHNLLYFVGKLDLRMPVELSDHVNRLNNLSIPARYPDDLRRLSREFDNRRTEAALLTTKKVLKWLKQQLP